MKVRKTALTFLGIALLATIPPPPSPLFLTQDAHAQQEDTRPGATFAFDPDNSHQVYHLKVVEVETNEESETISPQQLRNLLFGLLFIGWLMFLMASGWFFTKMWLRRKNP